LSHAFSRIMHVIFRHIRPEARNAIRGQLVHSLVPAGATASDRECEQQQQQQQQLTWQVNSNAPGPVYRHVALEQWQSFRTGSDLLAPQKQETPRKSNQKIAVECVVRGLIFDDERSTVVDDATECATVVSSVDSHNNLDIASTPDLSSLTSEQADDMIVWLTDGDHEERKFATEQITELLWPLACTPCGSRVVQRALELVEPEEKLLLAAQLRCHVREAAKSPHANYVLQKCVELLPNAQVQFILDELEGRAVVTSRHRFGCRILQRLIEHCPSQQTSQVVEEVMSDAPRLCRHPFGNFVLQHILEHGTVSQQQRVVDVLVSDAPGLARHRIASHVLQRALVHCSAQDRNRLVDALTDGSPEELKSLAHSQYGSFVVREITGKRQA